MGEGRFELYVSFGKYQDIPTSWVTRFLTRIYVHYGLFHFGKKENKEVVYWPIYIQNFYFITCKFCYYDTINFVYIYIACYKTLDNYRIHINDVLPPLTWMVSLAN